MKVLKFGGTSVGTVESLTNVKCIVESLEEPAIVVVSALGGITDRLIATARKAEAGDEAGVAEGMEYIRDRHGKVIDALVADSDKDRVYGSVWALMSELERLYRGVGLLNDCSERTMDRIVSFGERMSSVIVASIVDDAVLANSLDFIRTSKRHGKNRLDNDATAELIERYLTPLCTTGKVVVTGGFISTGQDGVITNLGRGGSDYTAAILASHFNAGELEIWTDVDGFLTSDPRKTQGTHIIDRMTFVEAMELCNFGAKVIYPPTIYPVFHKNIPVYIKNTFNPSAPGTRISDLKSCGDCRGKVVGISSLADTAIVSVKFMSVDHARRSNARVLNALARKGVDILLSDNRSGVVLHYALRNSDVLQAVEELQVEFGNSDDDNLVTLLPAKEALATVAAVGENLHDQVALHNRIVETLSKNEIPVYSSMASAGGSSVAVVVDLENERKSLQILHTLIFNK